VEHIVAAESALRRLEVATEDYADGAPADRPRAGIAIDAARGEITRALAAEEATGMYPGEADLTAAANRTLSELDVILARMRDLTSSDPAAGKQFAERDVRSGVERTDAAFDRILALNAAQAHAEVTRIAHVRTGAIRAALGLDLLCMVFSALAAFVAVRALRRQRAVEEVHEEMLETRAEELEAFARRVAHDLLSPLSALSFTLATVKRNAERGLPVDEPLQRSVACLKRSQRLVDGVLDFARSAASPSPGERASLRDAIDGVLEEVRSDEGSAAGVTLAAVPWDDDVVIPCSPGILASILANLVRNAVKYVGDGEGEEKSVTVRVLPGERDVRVEVEDTGPGVSPELGEHVFEPYFRAPNNAKPGLGLGLATVRRFVEAHRGRVGVHPGPVRGSVFWFQLPCVAASSGAAAGPKEEIRVGNVVTGR
jgi:signal transduction histidine kinase